jgi:GT2 family glycosyltransferase
MQPPPPNTASIERRKSTNGTSPIRGHLEQLTNFSIRGWAYDQSKVEERLLIDVVDEQGRVVAQGKADIFRGDLKSAGIADGACCFVIPLPEALADGMPHRIRAMVTSTGEPIPGELEVKPTTPAPGEITGLDGRFLAGLLFDTAARETAKVELVEEGAVLSAASVTPSEDANTARFRLPIPDAFLDGRPHAFVVRAADTARVIAGTALVTPSMTTSAAVLRRSAAAASRGWSDARARYRYESLSRQLASLLGDRAPGWEERLATVQAAHRLLVRGFESADNAEETSALSFPEVAAPKVSVVIPARDQLAVTLHCLASLILAPNAASFEVIVVDDGSTDGTRELAELVKGARYVRNEGAHGFVHATNLGASKARGEYVVMLNNDCEVTADWLDALLDVFERFDSVGVAGGKLLYADGRLQEAGGLVWGGGEVWNYGRDGNAADPKYNYARQTDYVSGACLMTPKKLWDALGGFDEHYAPAYYEDVDLAFRARKKGHKTVYTPLCEVFHFEGMSNGKSTDSGVKRYQKVNEPKFRARWAPTYSAHARLGREPADAMKDRQVTLRALVIDAETPQPDRDAGSYAILQEIRLLQSLGFKVTFAPENGMHLGAYTEALQRMGVECLFAPFAGSPADVLQRRGGEFDLVYVARYYVAATFIDLVRRHAPQARVVLNNIDLHFLRQMRAALARDDQGALEQALRVRDEELAVMRKVDLVLSYNNVEHAVILSHNVDATRVAVCPWVVAAPDKLVPFRDRVDIAFLGGFQHEPNVDAVEYFVGSVMPLLRKRLPGVRLLVYGSHAPEGLKKLEAADVAMKGFVPNVEDVYETCRVFVAPLRSGAGLKGKVIGAFAHGVPCVLSPVAAEGIRMRDGEEAFVADAPGAWVSTIAGLYEDETRWNLMSEAAHALARREYSFEKGRETMEAALNAVGIFVATNPGAPQALVSRALRS